MTVITLRKLSHELSRFLESMAKKKKMSMAKIVINLLQERAGIKSTKKTKPSHHELDSLAGSWTNDESKVFEQTLSAQRSIDKELWQ